MTSKSVADVSLEENWALEILTPISGKFHIFSRLLNPAPPRVFYKDLITYFGRFVCFGTVSFREDVIF